MTEQFWKLLEMEAMADLFLKILNMSFSATWLVGAVVLARFALKKAPKWVNVVLWGMVALRLLVPFSLESNLSLMPKAQTITQEIMMDPSPAIDSGVEIVDEVVNPILSESFAPDPAASANPLQILIPVFSWVWLAGVMIMGLYTLLSYWRIRHRVRMAIRVEQDLYLSEYVDSPFVLGLWKPRIYLPYHMKDSDRSYVIAHERVHIRRHDHWWKPLGFALLTVHWFNPALWVAYLLLCRDIELACDEQVIQAMEPEHRANYSQALLNCSVHSRAITACPLAFGEVGVKARVKNVLSYKKPGFWIIAIAVVLCMVVAVCFLTDPNSNIAENIVQEKGYQVLWETKSVETDFVIHKFDRSAESLVTTDDLGLFHAMYHVTPGSPISMKEARFVGENQEYLQLTFDFNYNENQMKNRILLPYTLTEQGYQYTLALESQDITDENGNVFPDACHLSGFGPGEEFTITMKAEVWDQAEENISFPLTGFRAVFFREDGLFSDHTPYPITRNLAFYLSQLNTAQLTLWDEAQTQISLSREDIIPLQDALSDLTPGDFEKDKTGDHIATLMLGYNDEEVGVKNLLLATDGEYVQFIFDSETGDALGGETWCVKDQAVNEFFANLLPPADAREWGVSLKIESVGNNGATILLQSPKESRFSTGSSYALERFANGQWEEIPTLQDAVWTTELFLLSNTRRFQINWDWLYGELPAGQYRISKYITKVGTVEPHFQTGVVYGEFTLGVPVHSPYEMTRDFGKEGLGASADFLDGNGYNFFPDESQELADILRNLEAEDFFPAAVLDAKSVITVWDSETTLTLRSNGKTVEFASQDGTRWAVEDSTLNAFIRKINRHSPSESVYEIYNVAPLEELGNHYTIEEAVIDKVVVMINGDIRYNQEVWLEFAENALSGKEAWVRCMAVSEEGTEVYDIRYDRIHYTINTLSEGTVTEESYTYLKSFAGSFPAGSDADQFTYYVLLNDNTASWYTLMHSLTSSQPGAAIPFRLVYQDLVVFPEEQELKNGDVVPEMIYGVESAQLKWGEAELPLEDKELLKTLEQMLGSAKMVKGVGCPTGNVLTLTLIGGNTLTLNMASDSCGVWESGGVYYQYASGNEDFYALFAPELWSRAAFGEAGLTNGTNIYAYVYSYVNWQYFDRICGVDDTLGLMNGMFRYAIQTRRTEDISTVMYQVKGLDGAYAEYFSSLLNALYESTPHDFSRVCLENAPDSVRETLIELLGHARGISKEEAKQLLQSHLSS